MRILVTTGLWPSAANAARGSFVAAQARALAGRGHAVEVAVVDRWPSLMRGLVAAEGVRVHHVTVARPPGRWTRAWSGGLQGRLAARAVAGRFDVVHGHGVLPGAPTAVAAAGRLAGKPPVVVTAHGSDALLLDTGGAEGRAARRVGGRVRWIATSGAVAEALGRFGATAAATIGNGADFTPGDRAAARAALGLPAAAPVALAVGNLTRVKGTDVLLAAWPAVAARVPDARLVLVGDGPRRPATAPAAVDLAGRRPHAEVEAWLRAADLLVLASRSEGYPTVLAEAAAVGLPAVATRVGGTAEALGDGGVLVATEDPAALAAAVAGLLADPSARATLAARAAARARTWDDVAARLEAVYREAAGAR